jgi:hypothetical protein
MNIDEIYEVKERVFLSSKDLEKKRQVSLTINKVEPVSFFGKEKLVLEFEETDKKFVLNQTNARMLSLLASSKETTNWLGKTITLKFDQTEFEGKQVNCLRVVPELDLGIK